MYVAYPLFYIVMQEKGARYHHWYHVNTVFYNTRNPTENQTYLLLRQTRTQNSANLKFVSRVVIQPLASHLLTGEKSIQL